MNRKTRKKLLTLARKNSCLTERVVALVQTMTETYMNDKNLCLLLEIALDEFELMKKVSSDISYIVEFKK